MVFPSLKGRGWDFPLCIGLFSATVDGCGLNQSQGMERLFISFCPVDHNGVIATVERVYYCTGGSFFRLSHRGAHLECGDSSPLCGGRLVAAARHTRSRVTSPPARKRQVTALQIHETEHRRERRDLPLPSDGRGPG